MRAALALALVAAAFDVLGTTLTVGPDAPLKTIATARSTPTDTQKCPMTGPSPCPVNLFTSLSSPTLEVLEVAITLNPSADKAYTPTVKSWQISYSCPPSE